MPWVFVGEGIRGGGEVFEGGGGGKEGGMVRIGDRLRRRGNGGGRRGEGNRNREEDRYETLTYIMRDSCSIVGDIDYGDWTELGWTGLD